MFQKFLKLVCCTAIAVSMSAHSADSIKIVIPFPPGGFAEILGRTIQTTLSKELDATVVVEYKSGAGGDIGTAYVANAPSTETVLLLNSSAYIINQVAKKNRAYNPKDIVPLINVGQLSNVLVVRSDSKLATVKDWINLDSTTNYNIGTGGVGSSNHLYASVFKKHINKKNVEVVPYPSGVPAFRDMLGGTVDASFVHLSIAEPFVQSGQVKIVGVVSEQRLVEFPDVPTFQEAGIKNLNFYSWAGVFANNNPNNPRIQKALMKLMTTAPTNKLYEYNQTKIQLSPVIIDSTFITQEKNNYTQLFKYLNLNFDDIK